MTSDVLAGIDGDARIVDAVQHQCSEACALPEQTKDAGLFLLNQPNCFLRVIAAHSLRTAARSALRVELIGENQHQGG
jgi:hypothetical protein